MSNRTRITDLIIAIIVGIGIWAYVINVLDPVSSTTVKNVPVQLVNQESIAASGLAIAGTGEYTVDVVVGGTRSNVSNVQASELLARADVSDLHIGQNYITVEVEAPSNLTVNEIRTQSIQVYVDNLVSEIKPLILETSNKGASQELGNITLSEDTIRVSGAESLVNIVAGVKAPIDAAGILIDEEFTQSVRLVPVDAEGNTVRGVKLSISDLDVTATLYETKEVALGVPLIGEFSDEIKVLSELVPASIVIKGPMHDLAEIWTIDADAIYRSEIKESCSIAIHPITPGDIEVADASKSLAAVYEVIGRTEMEFTFSNESSIIFINVPERTSVALAEDIVVKVSVYEDDAEVLNASDFIVTVDCENNSEGIQQCPIYLGLSVDLAGLRTELLKETATVQFAPADI